MPKTCPSCQSQAPDDANHCPNCGAALNPAAAASGAASAAPGPPPNAGPATAVPAAASSSGTSLPPFAFDIKRLQLADLIAGVASFLLLISLFLSWFGITVIGVHLTASGTSTHGWLWIVFIICLAILAYLVCLAGWGNLPFAPQLPHVTVMIAATVVNFVLVFIAFIDKPGGGGVGWEFGAFLALIASIVAAAPYAIPQLRAKTMN